MFKPSLLFIMFFAALVANAQKNSLHRYKDQVFTDISVQKDLNYTLSTPANDKKSHLFDLYQPKNDHNSSRPLIIWMHGGGFKFGSKNAKGIKLWSTTFAQRGYVCAAINYSLSKKNPLFHFDELLKSSYYAVQDAKQAVEFFKKNHTRYHVDPDKIFLGGNSAGGIIALQTAYSSNTDLAKMAGLPDTVINYNKREIFKVAGVINFWGGIYELKWLKNARVPIISILGSNDKIVLPTHKDAPLYGGIDIHEQANVLKIPNRLKIFEGYSHELQKHFNPIFSGGAGTRERWLQAGQFAADFIYDKVLDK